MALSCCCPVPRQKASPSDPWRRGRPPRAWANRGLGRPVHLAMYGVHLCLSRLPLIPNPPNRVVVALERDLSRDGEGIDPGVFRAGGASSGPVTGEGAAHEVAGGSKELSLADSCGASWRYLRLAGWMRERVAGRLPAPPSGRERQGAQSSQGATELGLPRPASGQVQCPGGEPSG